MRTVRLAHTLTKVLRCSASIRPMVWTQHSAVASFSRNLPLHIFNGTIWTMFYYTIIRKYTGCDLDVRTQTHHDSTAYG